MRLSLVAATLVALGCGGGDEREELDCNAFCNVQTCGGWDRAACMGDCACWGAIVSDEFVAAYNDCGTRDTCGAIDACVDNADVFGNSTIADEGLDACYAWAGRCGEDGGTCDLYAAFLFGVASDDEIQRHIDCWDETCGSHVSQCIEQTTPPECR